MKIQFDGNLAYQQLISNIAASLAQGRTHAVQQVNTILVQTYWQIGKHIVEFEQKGNEKAEYGSRLLQQLAHDLKATLGKGFSKSNVYFMRQFFLAYPTFQSVSGKLGWSHYTELLAISDPLARSFYLPDIEMLRGQLQQLLQEQEGCNTDTTMQKQGKQP